MYYQTYLVVASFIFSPSPFSPLIRRESNGENGGVVTWLAEKRWGLQARLASKPDAAMLMAAICATLVYVC